MDPKVSISFFENIASPGTCSCSSKVIESIFVKLFVVLSDGVSHNVKLFRDLYVELVDKVSELEKVSPNMEIVSQAEIYKVRCELSIVQSEKAILESKLTSYEDVVEEVSMLKATIASLKLDKVSLVDKIAMLDHVV
ncbi:unnamed protein product [Lactuca saligna]|uniref:Uncharacterized protein n=1 Tax=Lactuca saligna TaxID=75948 RepID=A0AA35ZE21_LACSI|nr:unnamed protein product [Lactuca saligna]